MDEQPEASRSPTAPTPVLERARVALVRAGLLVLALTVCSAAVEAGRVDQQLVVALLLTSAAAAHWTVTRRDTAGPVALAADLALVALCCLLLARPGIDAHGVALAVVLVRVTDLRPCTAAVAAAAAGTVDLATGALGPGGSAELGVADLLFVPFLAALALGLAEVVDVLRRHDDLVSRTAELESSLRFVRRHDPATRVLQRDVLLAETSARPQRQVAVCLVHVEGVDEVNAEHGWLVGDQALAATAERLRRLDGDGVQVARWGGSTFVVVGRGGAPEAEAWAGRLRRVLGLPLETAEGEPGGAVLALRVGVGSAVGRAGDLRELAERARTSCRADLRRHGVVPEPRRTSELVGGAPTTG